MTLEKFPQGSEEDRLGNIEKRSIGTSEETNAVDLEGNHYLALKWGWSRKVRLQRNFSSLVKKKKKKNVAVGSSY